MTRRWICVATLVLMGCGARRAAAADAATGSDQAAASLATEGRALRQQRDFRGALERFRAADAIMGVPPTGYELARAEADAGHLLVAQQTARRVATEPTQSSEPESYPLARQRAAELATELDARIGSVRFVFTGLGLNEVASLSLDGERFAVSSSSTQVRVDPGPHRVVVSLGRIEVVRDFDAVEGRTLEVPLTLRPPVTSSSEPKQNAHPHHLTRIALTVGAAGFVVGSVAGLFALSKSRNAEHGCIGSKCPPSTWSDLEGARSLATVSTIGFAVAGAAGGVALLSWLVGKPPENPPLETSIFLSKQVSSLGVSGRF